MSNQHLTNNALGVGREAEFELIGLVLRYELVEKVQVNWRRNREATLKAVSTAIFSSDSELQKKAKKFVGALSSDVYEALVQEGLPEALRAVEHEKVDIPPAAKTKTMMYRGQRVVKEV